MRTVVIAIALAALAGAGCKKPGGDKPQTAQEAPPIKLAPEDVVAIKRDMLETGPRISGTLEASLRSVVRAESAGSVVSIGPELGQSVKKGDLLARIEAKALGDAASSARSGLAGAEAARAAAEAQRELDRAQSQLKQAEAAVVQARAQVAAA